MSLTVLSSVCLICEDRFVCQIKKEKINDNNDSGSKKGRNNNNSGSSSSTKANNNTQAKNSSSNNLNPQHDLNNKIIDIFCQHFRVTRSQLGDILPLFDNGSQVPYCEKCRWELNELLKYQEKLESINNKIQKLTASISQVIVKTSNRSLHKRKRSADQDDDDDDFSDGPLNEGISLINNSRLDSRIRNLRNNIAQKYEPRVILSQVESKNNSISSSSNDSQLENDSSQTVEEIADKPGTFVVGGKWKFVQIAKGLQCSTCSLIKPSIFSMKRHIWGSHNDSAIRQDRLRQKLKKHQASTRKWEEDEEEEEEQEEEKEEADLSIVPIKMEIDPLNSPYYDETFADDSDTNLDLESKDETYGREGEEDEISLSSHQQGTASQVYISPARLDMYGDLRVSSLVPPPPHGDSSAVEVGSQSFHLQLADEVFQRELYQRAANFDLFFPQISGTNPVVKKQLFDGESKTKVCKLCKEAFDSAAAVKFHEEMVHTVNQPRLTCCFCAKSFQSPNRVIDHQLRCPFRPEFLTLEDIHHLVATLTTVIRKVKLERLEAGLREISEGRRVYSDVELIQCRQEKKTKSVKKNKNGRT